MEQGVKHVFISNIISNEHMTLKKLTSLLKL